MQGLYFIYFIQGGIQNNNNKKFDSIDVVFFLGGGGASTVLRIVFFMICKKLNKIASCYKGQQPVFLRLESIKVLV